MLLLRPLRQRPMVLLWGGLALSAIGDQAYAVAFAWIVVEAFGAAAGWLVALGPLVLLATVLFGGRLADNWAPLRAMLAADVIRAAVLLGVVFAWSAAGSPSPVALVAAVVVLGFGQAVFRPALQAAIPALVPDPLTLPAANALLDATERIARLVGPALVGALAAVLPIRHMLTVDAATFLASAAALWAIQRSIRVPASGSSAPGSVLASMMHGVHIVRRHRLLGYVLITTGVVNGAWYAAFFLILPLMTARHALTGPGGSGIAAYGTVISAYGCTNLLANLLVGNRPMPARPARLIFCGVLCTGGGILGLATIEAAGLPHAALLPAYAIAAACCAVGGPMSDIPLAVLRQTELPRADIPAATRAFMAANQGGLLLTLVAAPAFLALLPLPAVVGLCGGAIVVIGAVGMRRYV
jgi:MFS family permease